MAVCYIQTGLATENMEAIGGPVMRNPASLILACAVLAFSVTASAAKTCTKEQLIRMSDLGDLPAQGPPRTVKTESIRFDSCVSRVRSIVASLEGYPYYIVLDIADAYSAKIWTNDAAMILTCSRPDQKLVVTQSDYL